MTWGICVGGAIRMLSQVIHFKDINTGFFSQDARGRDVPYNMCCTD